MSKLLEEATEAELQARLAQPAKEREEAEHQARRTRQAGYLDFARDITEHHDFPSLTSAGSLVVGGHTCGTGSDEMPKPSFGARPCVRCAILYTVKYQDWPEGYDHLRLTADYLE